MCASDAIAALTLINSAAYPKLFSIVFGEGLLNDAVAIILFDVSSFFFLQFLLLNFKLANFGEIIFSKNKMELEMILKTNTMFFFFFFFLFPENNIPIISEVS